jgi:hypothetical protein
MGSKSYLAAEELRENILRENILRENILDTIVSRLYPRCFRFSEPE